MDKQQHEPVIDHQKEIKQEVASKKKYICCLCTQVDMANNIRDIHQEFDKKDMQMKHESCAFFE